MAAKWWSLSHGRAYLACQRAPFEAENKRLTRFPIGTKYVLVAGHLSGAISNSKTVAQYNSQPEKR